MTSSYIILNKSFNFLFNSYLQLLPINLNWHTINYNQMDRKFQPQLRPIHTDTIVPYNSTCYIIFYIFFFLVEGGIIALFLFLTYCPRTYNYAYTFVDKDNDADAFIVDFKGNYKFLTDILIMMLLGYGFLSSYVRFHRWSSLGFTFFIACMAIQMHMLWYTFWYKWFNSEFSNNKNSTITFDIQIKDIIMGAKCAITVLISYGALLGKIDLFQILVVTII